MWSGRCGWMVGAVEELVDELCEAVDGETWLAQPASMTVALSATNRARPAKCLNTLALPGTCRMVSRAGGHSADTAVKQDSSLHPVIASLHKSPYVEAEPLSSQAILGVGRGMDLTKLLVTP